ncbi:ankyrin repeat-containing domain protein [Mycena filopes]|nr:ankyrin repeat-containing domain protein [Mycena filopes]
MAEALGTIASLLQVLDTASKTWEHIQDFCNAPQEERQIRIEMGYLNFTLKKLQQQIHQQTTPNLPTPPTNLNPFGPQIIPKPSGSQTPPNPSIQWIQDMNRPLTTFKEMMEEFESKLGDLNTVTTFKKKVKWSLGGKKEAAEYLAKFEQFKSLINTWLLVDLVDMSRDQSDLLESVELGVKNLESGVTRLESRVSNLDNNQHAAERTQIIDWFSPINFFQQHADIASARKEGTGSWLMVDPCFKEWKEGLRRTLWCHGILYSFELTAGAGKTVLVSMVVDHLGQGTTARTACIYLNHKETEVQTPANLLASIWRQLVIGGRDISEVRTAYHKHLEKKTRPSLSEIEKIVHSEIGMSKVYIVVDAVDEYPEDLRQILLSVLAAMGPTCNLMITSRPHIVPSTAFQNIKFLKIRANVDDIQAYVNREIQNSPHLSKCVQRQPALIEEIHAKISGRVDGMFLLAKLHMKALAEQRTLKKVWTALNNLPETLAETYADAMRRIDTQSEGDRQIAQAVLTWVTHAKQILSVADLRVALAIEPGAKELDDDDLLDIETILGVCAGLIIVDEHLSVVRLVHYTTQEYMDSISVQHFPRAQIKITRSLLTFLSFESVWNLITQYRKGDNAVELPPLLQYCQYCLTHAAGEPEKDLELQSMLVKFIHQVPLWMKFAQTYWERTQWTDLALKTSPLAVAALRNLLEVGRILIEQGQYSGNMAKELNLAAASGRFDMARFLVDSGADVNAQDGVYGTALQTAVCQKHKEVVQLLLEHGADVNAQGGEYGNALQGAVMMAQKEVVQLLTEHGADVNAWHQRYGNALHAAALEGMEEVVQLLIDKGANVNAQGGQYGNALQAALRWRHKDVVQLLIEHGADVNAQGGAYGNALQAAVYHSNMEIVQLLIEHGADVNAQGGEYGNALQTAVYRRHKEVLQLLIEHGADVQGGEYGNALQAAAMMSPKEVVQLLIDQGANVNAQGGEYGNALQAAVYHSNIEVVQLLIEHGADVNAWHQMYGNALHAAALESREEVVQLLLDHGAEVNAQGGEYGNALQAAAMMSQKGVVQLLIERGADVNAQGGAYGNALQAAAANGQSEVVELLIDHGADVDAQGGKYGNALQAAAVNGYREVVELLIEHGADVNAQGGEYGNALQAAAMEGREEIVQLLIDHGANVNAQGGDYGNTLQAAAVNGQKEVVELLIEHSADVNAEGGEYGTALQAAALEGQEEVVHLLIEHGANVNAQGGEYGNALQAAAVNGQQNVVQLLLDKEANVNAQSGEYGNALQAAVYHSNREVVQLLIDHGADVDAQGGKYGNALQAAAVNGYREVVELLIDHAADVNAQGGEYGNPLQAAAYWGHEEIIHLLIEHGVDVNTQGGNYGNALQAAAVNGQQEVVQLLIEYGANVNAQGGVYGNVLQAAAYWGHEEVVQLLIDHAVDVNALGGKYSNALQAAAYWGYEEVVHLLIEHGADVNTQGGKYGNALQAAAVNGQQKVVQLLIEYGANVNAQGGVYGNVLQAAAHHSHKHIVQLLIKHGANVNAQYEIVIRKNILLRLEPSSSQISVETGVTRENGGWIHLVPAGISTSDRRADLGPVLTDTVPASLERSLVTIMPYEGKTAPSIKCLTPTSSLRILKIVALKYDPRRTLVRLFRFSHASDVELVSEALPEAVLKRLRSGYLDRYYSYMSTSKSETSSSEGSSESGGSHLDSPSAELDFDPALLSNILCVRFPRGLRHFELHFWCPVPALNALDLKASRALFITLVY